MDTKTMTSKERYLATLRGLPHDRTPVTPIFMAWAARYIGRTYRDFYLDGKVLAEAQFAVTRAFDIDQISAISDPWRESSGYGMEFDYPDEGVGKPRGYIINFPSDAARLKPIEIARAPRMDQRVESVRSMATAVGATHSVLGWIEGPIAQYADLRGLEATMIDLIDSPEAFDSAAEVIIANGLAFAKAQLRAGADTIGVGDAAASLVGPAIYGERVLPWERRLIDGIHDAGGLVNLHICGNIRSIIADMAAARPDIIDVDWMVPLTLARQAVGPDMTLCGNMDPSAVILQGMPQTVAAIARRCIADGGDRFILMPGCEVPPATPEVNIRAFCPGQGCLIRADLARG